MTVLEALRAETQPTISPARAAAILGIDGKTIREAIRKDAFPPSALVHVLVEPRIDPQALADYVERKQQASNRLSKLLGSPSRWPPSEYDASIHRTITMHEDPELGADPQYTAHKVGRMLDGALVAAANGIKEEGLVSTSWCAGVTTYEYEDGRIETIGAGL